MAPLPTAVVRSYNASAMTIHLVSITTKDKEEARTIGKALIEEKLAACVNIFDGVNALYVWEGKLHDEDAAVLIAKATEEHVPELMERVKELHSDDCPCILVLPVVDGHPEYVAWLRNVIKK
jgi:periplasmic divalent cation tolerance protein